MIKFKEDGQNFSSALGFTRTCYREVEAEEYHRLLIMTQKQLDEEVESCLSQDILCGYGYYGAGLAVRDGRFYVTYRRGTSCD